MDNLKKILEFSTLFYVLMIFLSFFQVHLYYNYFGISIYYYITLQELLFYFIPYFVIASIKISFLLLLISPLIFIVFLIFKRLLTDNCKSKFKTFFKNESIPHLLSSFTLIILLTILLLFIISLNKWEYGEFYKYVLNEFIHLEGIWNWAFKVLFALWSISFYIFILKLIKMLFARINIKLFNITYIVVILFVFTTLKTIERINNTNKGNIKEKYEFVYEDRVIRTDSVSKMIGTSKDYYFIKNFQSDSIYVYETSKISNLKLISE